MQFDKLTIKVKLPTLIACTLIFSMVILSFICSTASPKSTFKVFTRWGSPSFEENIMLNYSPKNPNALEPVVITIESKHDDLIKGANLYLNCTFPDGSEHFGGVQFTPPNSAVMSCVISNYPDRTNFTFYVAAWDDSNEVLYSKEYQYTVKSKDSWKYPSFEENLMLNYSPENPNAFDEVVVIIEPRDIEGYIKGANLYLVCRFLDGSVDSYGLPFIRENETAMVCTLLKYPPKANITFWVEAWDTYNTSLTSNRYNFTVGILIYGEYDFETFPQWYVYAAYGAVSLIAVPAVGYFYYMRKEEKKRFGE